MYIRGSSEVCLPRTPRCIMARTQQKLFLPHITFLGSYRSRRWGEPFSRISQGHGLMKVLPFFIHGFQDLPERDSSPQEGSDTEEHNMKGLCGPGLSGAHHFCLLRFDWLELSHMMTPNHKGCWNVLSLVGYHFPVTSL